MMLMSRFLAGINLVLILVGAVLFGYLSVKISSVINIPDFIIKGKTRFTSAMMNVACNICYKRNPTDNSKELVDNRIGFNSSIKKRLKIWVKQVQPINQAYKERNSRSPKSSLNFIPKEELKQFFKHKRIIARLKGRINQKGTLP